MKLAERMSRLGTETAFEVLGEVMKLRAEGKEVISTPITFISTNHAILYNNAIPVFADIYPDTLNISVEEIEKNITPSTKAIITVHYGGHPCDMDPILRFAKAKGIKIIEDAAHGTGSEYKGKKIGSIGDIACFSFHAVKNLAVGEGGMITVDDDEIDDRLRRLRWLGINKSTWVRSEGQNRYSWEYDVDEIKALLSIYSVLIEEIWAGSSHYLILLNLHGKKENMTREELKKATGVGGAFVLKAINELNRVGLLDYDMNTNIVTLKKRLFPKK